MNDYRQLIIIQLKHLQASLDYENDLFANHVATFVKATALQLEDAEIIGLASVLEQKSRKLLDEEFNNQYEQHSFYEKDEREENYRKSVRQLCIQVFYKDENNGFSVDMSKYQKLVEDNKALLEKFDKYKSMSRYVKEKTVIDKIYYKIKGDLQYRETDSDNPELPTVDEIKGLFPIELKEIYRLADNYIEPKIEELKRKERDNAALS